MQVFGTIAEMRAARSASRAVRQGSGRLGLVPTMGALHAGHVSLIRAARAENEGTAVSIFVNPTQFGPGEDFTQYPRPMEADLALLAAEGVDFVFAPSAEEMYPRGPGAVVEVGALADRLDGAFRPGHFRGVATVVAKLFHIVEPDAAYFGQKDAAQVAVLRAMVRALDFPLRMEVCPTMREPDGLAMSSRNRYLSLVEQTQALAISRALGAARTLWEEGEEDAARLRAAMLRVLDGEAGVRMQYVEVVDPDTLEALENVSEGALLAVAAHVGATRLIDNVVLPARASE